MMEITALTRLHGQTDPYRPFGSYPSTRLRGECQRCRPSSLAGPWLLGEPGRPDEVHRALPAESGVREGDA